MNQNNTIALLLSLATVALSVVLQLFALSLNENQAITTEEIYSVAINRQRYGSLSLYLLGIVIVANVLLQLY